MPEQKCLVPIARAVLLLLLAMIACLSAACSSEKLEGGYADDPPPSQTMPLPSDLLRETADSYGITTGDEHGGVVSAGSAVADGICLEFTPATSGPGVLSNCAFSAWRAWVDDSGPLIWQ